MSFDRLPARGLLAALALAAGFLLSTAPAFAAAAPSIDSESARSVEYVGATLQGEINPNEAATTYRFEYGPDAGYGSSVPASDAAIGAGTEDVYVRQFASGLEPGKTYHYRLAATNAEGTSYGADKIFRTYPKPLATTDSCPNAGIRMAQFANYLPDCRAYEMVSPLRKNGGNVAAMATLTQSSASGEAIKYTSTTAFADAQGIESQGTEYLAQRSPDGWVTHGINPAQEGKPLGLFISSQYEYLSQDLSKGVYYASTPVLPGHPNVEGVPNLYLSGSLLSAPPGSYQLLSDSTTNLGTAVIFAEKPTFFAGASADGSHIIFESIYDLTQEAAGLSPLRPKLYEWHNGTTTLAGILPKGEVAESSAAGAGAGAGGYVFNEGGTWTERAISADGSRVIFTAPPITKTVSGLEGNLYMRIDGKETIQINASERATPDPRGPQPALFKTATASDAEVFFETTEALTDDAAAGERGMFFYRYDTEAPAGKHLTLLASTSGGTNPQDNAISGISADGSYVYFVADQVREGDPAGSCGDLYVWHEGKIRFITTRNEGLCGSFAEQGHEGWGDTERQIPDMFRVSPDGKAAVFGSRDPGTALALGYENPNPTPYSSAFAEVYVYNYDTDKLACASCNPSGAAPVSNTGYQNYWFRDSSNNYVEIDPTMYLDRPLSDNGQYVFFDTADALVPQDVNNQRDVYEYDTLTGEVHLISSGTCNCGSFFVDASADGSNVFFTTFQQLVRADTDTNADLYDARIDGGIQSQNEAPPAPCVGDDCQGPASGAPTFSVPASQTFAGVGNPAPQARKVRKHATSKKRRHKRKARRHKRKGRHHKRKNGSQAHARRSSKATSTSSGR